MEMPRLSENLIRIRPHAPLQSATHFPGSTHSPPPASFHGRFFSPFRHFLFALLGALLLAPGFAQAANQLAVNPTGGSYWSNNELHISISGNYTISMASPGATTTTDSIVVDPGVTAHVTLNGVKINLSSNQDNSCAFNIASGATVNLTLGGDNVLTSGVDSYGSGYDGLSVQSNSTLTIDGTGTLTATGGNINGAGIGGGGNSITINNGTITAYGGLNAPGIGGGSDITINGGTINATGGSWGAGIGGRGDGGLVHTITINGGTINATGGSLGAGIGGGSTGGGSGVITIHGGLINATAGSGDVPGIGGNYIPITITGNASVTATGSPGSGGAGIGSSNTITIDTTGTVIATGGGGNTTVGGGAPIGNSGFNNGTAPVTGSGISPIAAPADASVVVGGNVTFTVSVTTAGTAPNLGYQWQVFANGGPTWANVPGATAPTLTLNGVTADMYGNQYRCVVTAANGGLSTGTSITYTTHPAKLLQTSNSQFTSALPTGVGTMSATVSGGGSTCVFNPSATQMIAPSSVPAGQPFQFPYGLFTFELTGCTPGSTVTVTTIWPNLSGVTGYMKYGPTPTSGGQSVWYAPANLQIAGNTITYTVQDGGLGDNDLSANGVIRDPGGPTIPLSSGNSVNVPTLSEWALAALALALGWMALVSLPGRRKG